MFSPIASTLKSVLQQLDSQLGAKETFLHEQRSKLSEKDKVITTQKSEIERLEKKSKTLEYKVLSHFTSLLFSLIMLIAGFKNFLPSRSGRYPTEDDRDVRAGQTLTSAGTGDSGAKAAERADRQEAHGATHAGHGDGCKTEVGEGVCKWSLSSPTIVWSSVCLFPAVHFIFFLA